MKGSGILHTVSFAARLDRLQEIRRHIQETAAMLNADPDAAADLVQAVDEVATNIIEHGYQGKEGDINITLERQDHNLIIRVRDQAPHFDPTTVPAPDLTLPLEERCQGGLGIHFVRKCVDKIQYIALPQGGNELVLTKKAF